MARRYNPTTGEWTEPDGSVIPSDSLPKRFGEIASSGQPPAGRVSFTRHQAEMASSIVGRPVQSYSELEALGLTLDKIGGQKSSEQKRKEFKKKVVEASVEDSKNIQWPAGTLELFRKDPKSVRFEKDDKGYIFASLRTEDPKIVDEAGARATPIDQKVEFSDEEIKQLKIPSEDVPPGEPPITFTQLQMKAKARAMGGHFVPG